VMTKPRPVFDGMALDILSIAQDDHDIGLEAAADCFQRP